MTDNIKHSTSYYHEAIAHAFEMFKNGYKPVMETPFQPRRLGSAFVTEYKLVRDSLDEVVNFDIDKMDKALQSERIEIPHSLKMEEFDQFMQDKQLTIQQKWQIDNELDAEFDKLLEQSEPLPKELLDRMQDLRDKAEANREREEALKELAQQSQELGMYEVDNGIFDRLVDSIESAQDNPEGCVSTIVEVDKGQVKVYSKEELEDMEWSDFKKLIDAAGIRGRRRQNLTRDYLIYQEEIMK